MTNKQHWQTHHKLIYMINIDEISFEMLILSQKIQKSLYMIFHLKEISGYKNESKYRHEMIVNNCMYITEQNFTDALKS